MILAKFHHIEFLPPSPKLNMGHHQKKIFFLKWADNDSGKNFTMLSYPPPQLNMVQRAKSTSKFSLQSCMVK